MGPASWPRRPVRIGPLHRNTSPDGLNGHRPEAQAPWPASFPWEGGSAFAIRPPTVAPEGWCARGGEQTRPSRGVAPSVGIAPAPYTGQGSRRLAVLFPRSATLYT